MRSNKVTIRSFDWTIILLYLAMTMIGLINAHSSGYYGDSVSFFNPDTQSGRQFIWFGVSIAAAVFIILLERSFIKNSAYIFYGIIMLMLVAVLFFPPINGQRSWFGYGSFGIQPSEFAKTATALALARFMSTINIRIQNRRDTARAILLLLAPCILIYLQPDAGTLLVFLGFVFVLYREGMSGNILMLTLLAIVLGVLTIFVKDSQVLLPLINMEISGHFMIILVLLFIGLAIAFIIRNFIQKRDRRRAFILLISGMVMAIAFILVVSYTYEKILKDHQRTRIELTLGMLEDPDGQDYNRNRAMAAVGSGQLTGKGYKQATLANAKHGHVPEQTTDFAFCTWSEEWGFIGSAAVVILFVIFLVRIVGIAERQRSQFSRIYAYSVAGIFFMHFMINIGMVTGIAPVIGIPLPFISYGGSSLLSFSVLLFILLRLDAERMEVLR